MIVELNDKNIDLIEDLEKIFSDYFKNNGIKKDFMQNIFSKYFIYMEKSNIIGFVNYYDLYERFEIAYIEVKDDFRNQKVGSKLMDHLIELGKNKNITNITLEVNVENKYAIKLYEKYNFQIVAKRENYYNGVDGYLMERKMM